MLTYPTNEVLTNPTNLFRFIKSGMNIIDLLGILPYFMSLSLNLVTTTAPSSTYPTINNAELPNQRSIYQSY